jgi:hypothetical protein
MLHKSQGKTKASIRWPKTWLASHTVVVSVVACFAIVGAVTSWLSFAATPTPNVTVNFNSPVATLPTYPFGSTISTYGADNITSSANQSTNLKNLNLGLYRIPLQYNGGDPISSAGGSSSSISGLAWIQAIEQQVGAQPEIVLGGGSTTNAQFNDINPSDAGNMVSYFNTPGTSHYYPVEYYVIGNEPDNAGLSAAAYCSMYNSAAQQMEAAAASIAAQYGPNTPGASIQIGGPAAAWDDTSYLQSFLSCVNPSYLDFVDFHDYAMGSTPLTNAQVFTQADSYKPELQALQSMITSTLGTKASNITTQIGEYNWSWQFADGYMGSDAWDGSGNDVRFFEPVDTAWTAATVGNIAETGSRSFQYSDQNGPLGITFDDSESNIVQYYNQAINNPMPIYWGVGMYTGANLFRGFGSTVVSTSVNGLSNVEAFASSNSDNVVLVNESPTATQAANVGLTGFSGGTYDAWQTCGAISSGTSCTNNGQFSAPTQIAQGQVVSTNTISVSLPPYSVTTLVLYPTVPPALTGVAPTSVTANGATIAWTTNENSTSQVQYGTTTAYGTTTTVNPSMVTAHSATLTGLTPGTTYHYSVLSTNAENQTTTSTDYTFTTPSVPPTITSVTSSSVTANGATIAWTTNENSTSQVQYGTTTAYGTKSTENTAMATAHTVTLSGLAASTAYNYSVISVNSASQQSTSGNYTFTTSAATPTSVSGPIVGVASKCLDDTTSIFANANPVQLYGCNGTGAQNWTLPSDGTVRIDNKLYCLDTKGGATASGTLAVINSCSGAASQQWAAKSNGSLVNTHSGLCLDDKTSGTANGNPIQIYGCNGTGAQDWKLP